MARAPFAPSPREAALLLGRATGLTEAQLIARTEETPAPQAAARFRQFLERRLTGEPVAYIFGEREFYGRSFAVDDRVLIPRPETEHLIEVALELELPSRPRILDLGTGSGCIAVTLALELPTAALVATDLTPGALAVAAANARRHSVDQRVSCVGADLTKALELGSFDLVVSNPPYIDHDVRAELSPEVTDFEPEAALFAPGSGIGILERLLGLAFEPGVPLVVEIGHDQAAALSELAANHGFDLREIRPDLAGHPRVAVLEAPGP